MTIYMKLSKKEVRRICFANSFWDFRKQGLLLIVVLILSILVALLVVILNSVDILFAVAIMAMVAITVVRFTGTRLLKALHAIFGYWQKKTDNLPDYVETGDYGISFFSNNSLDFYAWSKGLDVYETKNFYFILTTNESRHAIPRRCFADRKQLDEFVTLLENKVAKERLHFKNYPIGIAAPDLMEQVIPMPPIEIEEEIIVKPAAEEELFAVRFSMRARDFLSILLWEYTLSTNCMINTIVGLFLWALFIVNIINGSILLFDVTMVLSLMFIVFPSLFILLVNPVRIYKATKAMFSDKSVEQNETSYQFYKDSYLMETAPEKTSKWVHWKNLVKIKELPNAYLLYFTKQTVHVIPKKVFAGAKDKKEMMKTLVRDAKSQMKTK